MIKNILKFYIMVASLVLIFVACGENNLESNFKKDYNSQVNTRDTNASNVKGIFDYYNVLPGDGDTNVAVNEDIIISFDFVGSSDSLDNSLNYNNCFKVSEIGQTSGIAGDIIINDSEVRFRAKPAFKANQDYNVSASKGCFRSKQGKTQAKQLKTNFKTMAQSQNLLTFKIRRHEPLNSSNNVPQNQDIKIVFSRDLRQDTVNNNSVKLFIQERNGSYERTLPISLNANYDTLKINAALQRHHSFRLVINNQLRSIANQALESEFMLNFNTKSDLISPIITRVFPAHNDHNIGLQTVIKVDFSEAILDPYEVSQSVKLYKMQKAVPAVLKPLTMKEVNQTFFSFKPNTTLESDSNYSLEILRGDIQDTGLNLLNHSDKNYSFATGNRSLDSTRLGVRLQHYKLEGIARNEWYFTKGIFPISPTIKVKFSRSINANDLSQITLKEAVVGYPTSTNVAITKTINNDMLSVKPNASLKFSTRYYFEIKKDSIKDIDNNALTNDVNFSFYTKDIYAHSHKLKSLKTGLSNSKNNLDDGFFQQGTARTFNRDSIRNIIKMPTLALIWQDDSDVSTRDLNFTAATAYCANKPRIYEHSWRLPSLMELSSLINYANFSGNYLERTFSNRHPSHIYWSADHSGRSADAMDFRTGQEQLNQNKRQRKAVRCVIGNIDKSTGHLSTKIKNSRIILEDSLNRLQWYKLNRDRNWTAAVTDCNQSLVAKNDWRLPNINELKTLSASNINSFKPARVWSGSVDYADENSSWVLSFLRFNRFNTSIEKQDRAFSVLCVRDPL